MDEDYQFKSSERVSGGLEKSSRRVTDQVAELEIAERDRKISSEEIVRQVQEGRAREASRKRWGWVLFFLGVLTIVDSCSLVPIPLIGPIAIWVGAIMAVIGAGLLASRGKMRDTNEAILVAMKYGNRLTIARLSLEMDISLTKAERIIQKLVKSGIAEIDLDQDKPEDGIVYKVKGI